MPWRENKIEQKFKVSKISQVTLWCRAQRACSLSKLSDWFQSQCVLLQQTAVTFALQGGNPAGCLPIPLRMPFRIWKVENPGSSPVNITTTSHPTRFSSALAKMEDQRVYILTSSSFTKRRSKAAGIAVTINKDHV